MSGSLDKVHFLVIDDNAYMLSIINTMLRGFGVTYIFDCRDAADAFSVIKNNNIDIVIVDYKMPVLDGIEFIQMFRRSSDSPNPLLPIIMLTAFTEIDRVGAARDAGVNEICCKPVTATELFRKIRNIIENPRNFVRKSDYFGPDRRRHKCDYYGDDRRVSDQPKDSHESAAPDQGQVVV